MLKRTIALMVLLAMTLTLVSTGSAPVKAAPAAVTNAPNASLLPADTAYYVDFHSADLNKVVQFATDTIKKVVGITVANPYAQIDKALTQSLKQPASFEKDIQPWLGDHITAGFVISDDQLSVMSAGSGGSMSMMSMFSNPNLVIILSVTDDAAAAAFVKEVIASSPSDTLTTKTDTINGASVTIMTQDPSTCSAGCGSIVEMKGSVVFGTTSGVNAMLATLKAGKPTLADDANFAKLMGTLKGDDLLSLYISPRFYQAELAGMQATLNNLTTAETPTTADMSSTEEATESAPAAAATPEANNIVPLLKSVYSIIQGQAMGVRMDGNLISMDVATSLDQKALASFFQQYNLPTDLLDLSKTPVAAKLADEIPAKAVAALMFNNLPKFYEGFKSTLGVMGNLLSTLTPRAGNVDKIVRGFNQFETGLKVGFNIDLQNDVFSWMGGEFATYMIYNPNSVLANMSSSPYPFDHTLLMQVTDPAKATSFLNKLNVGLGKLNITTTSAGDNLYKVDAGSKGLTLAYGLVGKTFVVTTGSGLDTATAAIAGDGVLSKTPEWQRAWANSVQPSSQYWYFNLTQLGPLVKTFMTMRSGALGGSDARQAQQMKIVGNVLDLFESATFSGGVLTDDGMSVGSLQINLK